MPFWGPFGFKFLKLSSDGEATFCSGFFWVNFYNKGKFSKSCLSLACWSWSIGTFCLAETEVTFFSPDWDKLCCSVILLKESNFFKIRGAAAVFFGVKNSTNFLWFSTFKDLAGNCFWVNFRHYSYLSFFIFSRLMSSRIESIIGLVFFGVTTLAWATAVTLETMMLSQSTPMFWRRECEMNVSLESF